MGTGLRTSSAFRTAEGESSPLKAGAETERPAASPPGAVGRRRSTRCVRASPLIGCVSRRVELWTGVSRHLGPDDRRGRVAIPLGLSATRGPSLALPGTPVEWIRYDEESPWLCPRGCLL